MLTAFMSLTPVPRLGWTMICCGTSSKSAHLTHRPVLFQLFNRNKLHKHLVQDGLTRGKWCAALP